MDSAALLSEEDKEILSENDGSDGYSPLRYLSSGRHYRSRRFFNWRNMSVLISVLLLIAGVSVWAHVVVLLRNFHCDIAPKEDRFEPDLLFSRRLTFQPHKYYGGKPSNTTNEMWRRLIPPGDGIVALPRKYTKNLPPSRPAPHDPDSDVYGVSMFHQLHCLNFLRYAYYPETVTTMPQKEVAIHRDHCLDYIRQAIMCHGDATFETLNEQGVLDGMGATHQCRDFDTMFTWAYERRSDRKNGSGYEPEAILTHTPAHRNEFDN